MVLARRGDKRIPWRREVEFGVGYDIAAGPGDRRRRGRARPRGDPARRRARRRSTCCATASATARTTTSSGTGSPISRRTAGPIRRCASTSRRRSRATAWKFPIRIAQLVRPEAGAGAGRRARPPSAVATLAAARPLRAADRRRARGARRRSRRSSVRRDDVIARQGEPADSLYILARGRVAVFDDSAGGTGVRDRLATLSAPAYFGEMGLLTGQARGATVVAEDRGALLSPARRRGSTRSCGPARSSWRRCRRWSHAPGRQRRQAAVAVRRRAREAGGRTARGPRPPDQGLLRASADARGAAPARLASERRPGRRA